MLYEKPTPFFDLNSLLKKEEKSSEHPVLLGNLITNITFETV